MHGLMLSRALELAVVLFVLASITVTVLLP